MSKFTKGHWSVNPQDPLEVRVDGQWDLIATTYNYVMKHEDRVANAKLIAAAPCLYDFIHRLSRMQLDNGITDQLTDRQNLMLAISNAAAIIRTLDLEES